MRAERRFSQAISAGDGIALLVDVADADAARLGQKQGARGLVVRSAASDLRAATDLPVLFAGGGRIDAAPQAGADAVLVVAADLGGLENELEQAYRAAVEAGLECVVEVRDDEELEKVLERVDPETLVLAPRDPDGPEALDQLLELLPDVPAGKLAIAAARWARPDDVAELERAGFDAAIVGQSDLAVLAGESARAG
jgi:indole-3-glycerol phosphate synthase